ncbi:hypothetical protein GGF46_005302 [Coemansia sp. RSA 552]|nr:hypothetical protein GGF46_005302 [Coemansia sp. RSA 552]
MTKERSTLEIVQHCNSVGDIDTLTQSEGLYRFVVNGRLAGLVSQADTQALRQASNNQPQPVFNFDDETKQITFRDWCAGCTARTNALGKVLAEMRAAGTWASLAKWRNELFPVYGDPQNPTGISLFMERAASYNFGIRSFAVFVNGIVTSGDYVRMWVAKRSLVKHTWPGYLDQLVAGGIGDGMGVWESVIKECKEESNIPEELARRAQPVGTVQYFSRSTLGLQPETLFIFDLELPADFVPTPNDGEVDSFYLWPLDQVLKKVQQGLFKPSCAMCAIDFMVRRGFITPENEPRYLDIIDNIHRSLPFPGPQSLTL